MLCIMHELKMNQAKPKNQYYKTKTCHMDWKDLSSGMLYQGVVLYILI